MRLSVFVGVCFIQNECDMGLSVCVRVSVCKKWRSS